VAETNRALDGFNGLLYYWWVAEYIVFFFMFLHIRVFLIICIFLLNAHVSILGPSLVASDGAKGSV
jgi:hypothetical protein